MSLNGPTLDIRTFGNHDGSAQACLSRISSMFLNGPRSQRQRALAAYLGLSKVIDRLSGETAGSIQCNLQNFPGKHWAHLIASATGFGGMSGPIQYY